MRAGSDRLVRVRDPIQSIPSQLIGLDEWLGLADSRSLERRYFDRHHRIASADF
jgi:hypothetical protein